MGEEFGPVLLFLADEGAVGDEQFGAFLLDLVPEAVVVGAEAAELFEPLHALVQPLEHRDVIGYLLLPGLPLELHSLLVGDLLLLRTLLLGDGLLLWRLLFCSGDTSRRTASSPISSHYRLALLISTVSYSGRTSRGGINHDSFGLFRSGLGL